MSFTGCVYYIMGYVMILVWSYGDLGLRIYGVCDVLLVVDKIGVCIVIHIPCYYWYVYHLLSLCLSLSSHSRDVINPINSSPVTFLTSTVLFTLIWLPTNYFYSRALLTIPPTDVTALFSTAPAFVFIFSMIILREPPLILRVCTVI